jgi:uncharacterized Zn finger protein (UPF0148 family)
VSIFKKAIVGTDGCVNCPTCGHEISVFKTTSLPREFSVLCSNCGGRKVYLTAEIHDRKPATETGQPSARIQFGTRAAVDRDQVAASMDHPKSRLGEIASWLLK